MLIEARSTVGPITFGAIGITGWVETVVRDGELEPGEHTRAHVEIALERFASGNRLYDAELLRRIDAAPPPAGRRSTSTGHTDRVRRPIRTRRLHHLPWRHAAVAGDGRRRDAHRAHARGTR